MAPKTSSLKRDKIRMQRVMPRTGAQIKELQFSCQRKELLEWVDAHQHMLPTLVFVCKSGMLEEMEADLRKEHWLPPATSTSTTSLALSSASRCQACART